MEMRLRPGDSPTAGNKKLARDLSSLEAGGAYVLALGVTVYESTDALDIWIPAATGTAI